MLTRHGIRNPAKKDILNGHRLLSEMKHCRVSPSVVKQLQSVVDSFPLLEASLLAKTGAEEQHELGHRTGRRLASVFRKSDRLTFVSSSSARTVSSLENFKLGLSDSLGWNVSSLYQQRDDLLRFFEACPRYLAEVRKNKTAFAEYRKFRERMFPHIIQRIADRLSVKTLNISDGMFYRTGIGD